MLICFTPVVSWGAESAYREQEVEGQRQKQQDKQRVHERRVQGSSPQLPQRAVVCEQRRAAQHSARQHGGHLCVHKRADSLSRYHALHIELFMKKSEHAAHVSTAATCAQTRGQTHSAEQSSLTICTSFSIS